MPDGWAWDGVWAGSLVDIVDNAWGRAVVGAWEGNLGGWASGGSGAGDGDLEAGWVDLDTWVGPCGVARNELLAVFVHGMRWMRGKRRTEQSTRGGRYSFLEQGKLGS